MSDVVVSVTESTTAVTVTEQDVAVAVTETSVDVSSNTAGIQGATGATGATGAGYSGVTSTSTITIGSGLKTFTLVSANQGAFLTGMRIRAIHSDTPTYYMEGTANYVGAGTLIITVDKFNGSGSHNNWAFAVAGEVGQTGATGASGVVSVTSPITNTGTAGSAIVGIDQTLLSITRSQVSDFTSGTVTSISGTVTQAQVTTLTTDLAGKASLGAANAFTVGGHVITNAATAVIPLVLRGVASQSANLFQLQSSSTAVVANFTAPVNNVSRLNLGGTDLSATLGVTVHASGGVGQVIRGAASQSANLQEWQNSAGTVLASISNIGTLNVNTAGTGVLNLGDGQISKGPGSGFSFTSGLNNITSLGIGTTALNSEPFRVYFGAATYKTVIRGAASQSANLTEWQNSAGTVLASISSAGLVSGKAADATVATASTGVGYMGLPQNTTTTGAYTIVAADAGKHVYASATRTVTIPANSALALPIGSTLTFIAGVGATMTIAITTDTMYLAGAGTTGSRTLAAHGIATAVKTTATTWLISGNGLT